MTAAATRLPTVIFDFDGVIVESLEAKADAFRTLFADYPEHVERIVRVHEENLGVSRYEKFRIIYRDYLCRSLDDAETRRLDARFSALVYDRVVSCDFVAGARECLKRAAREHALYVASATPQDELRRIVAARGLAPFFAGVRGSPLSKEQNVREILADGGYKADDVVFVGDALTDHAAAAANGLSFIGRVPAGATNPFGHLGVDTVADLSELDRRWDHLIARIRQS